MKVGGNESATKYFQTHGGSAALASKDPKAKYTSNAATKYKDELSRRVAIDAKQYATHYPTYTYVISYLTPTRYPEEVVITDIPETDSGDGTSTPGETDDDFFSSWDKPTIKRPSNPPSRTGTPLSGSRTASPFLNAPANGNGNGIARPKSPLSGDPESAPAAPPASRTTSSSAIRKATTGAAPRKTNILGAKKTKLGAKKLTPTDGGLDFEAAERKAREEAERIEKLGYDPEAEKAADAAAAKGKAASTETAAIVSPTPVSPPRAGFGATKPERSSAEMERLGMGIGRLGFGQVGGAKPAAAPRKMGGFGSTSRAVEGISSPPLYNSVAVLIPRFPQTTRRSTRAKNSAPRNPFPRTSSSAAPPTTRLPQRLRRSVCRALKALPPSRPTPTSAALKTSPRTTTVTSRARLRTSCAGSALLPVMISRIWHSWSAMVRRGCAARL